MDVRLRRVVVIKLGGSVLVDKESYREAARFLVRRLHRCSSERFVVVVSAEKGLTDELERLAELQKIRIQGAWTCCGRRVKCVP